MYVEDLKDPAEVQPPSGDRISIIPRLENPRDHVPSTLLDDLPIDLRHSSMMKLIVSVLSELCIAGWTHIVNWFIASRTD